MNNEFLNNLKEDESGLGWLEGTFESKSLFQGEMKIVLMDNTEETKVYAEKCLKHYNVLNNNKLLLENIQNALANFMFYMYEEWKAMGRYTQYAEIAENIEPIINEYKKGNNLLKYLTKPELYIELPEGINEIGYVIQTECPWEPEHMCAIVIRENELKYVGPSEGNTPWDDDDEYYCIWNDNDVDE